MKYKVGDRVRIKSIDWYNENKRNADKTNSVWCEDGGAWFYYHMSQYCGKIMTIENVWSHSYTLEGSDSRWTDEMIEGLVEDENNRLTETVVDYVKESNDRYRIVIDPRFDIEVDEGEYYVVRRKKEYPKTYEECLSVLGIYNGLPDVEIYNAKPSECKLFESLIRLKRCRDAYWKIAGEEMGLDGPWKPDWDIRGYYAIARSYGNVVKTSNYNCDLTFVFPTEEMRDAFYENFKEFINEVKELL